MVATIGKQKKWTVEEEILLEDTQFYQIALDQLMSLGFQMPTQNSFIVEFMIDGFYRIDIDQDFSDINCDQFSICLMNIISAQKYCFQPFGGNSPLINFPFGLDVSYQPRESELIKRCQNQSQSLQDFTDILVSRNFWHTYDQRLFSLNGDYLIMKNVSLSVVVNLRVATYSSQTIKPSEFNMRIDSDTWLFDIRLKLIQFQDKTDKDLFSFGDTLDSLFRSNQDDLGIALNLNFQYYFIQFKVSVGWDVDFVKNQGGIEPSPDQQKMQIRTRLYPLVNRKTLHCNSIVFALAQIGGLLAVFRIAFFNRYLHEWLFNRRMKNRYSSNFKGTFSFDTFKDLINRVDELEERQSRIIEALGDEASHQLKSEICKVKKRLHRPDDSFL